MLKVCGEGDDTIYADEITLLRDGTGDIIFAKEIAQSYYDAAFVRISEADHQILREMIGRYVKQAEEKFADMNVWRPNERLAAAMDELESGGGERFDTVEDMFKSLSAMSKELSHEDSTQQTSIATLLSGTTDEAPFGPNALDEGLKPKLSTHND